MALLEIAPDDPIPDSRLREEAGVVVHRSGSRPPLVLTHTWINEVRHLQSLARAMGPDQPLYAVLPPRGERREGYPWSIDSWADFCLPTIRAIQPRGPYRLGGWSLGGIVALEAARRLAAAGETIHRVLLLDSWVPRHEPRGGRSFPHELVHYLDELLDLPRSARATYVRALLRRLAWRERRRLRGWGRRLRRRRGAAPPQPPPDPRRMPLLRSVRVSYLKYEPRPTDLPVAVLWCEDSRARAGDAALGWSPYLRGPFASLPVGGMHRTLFDEPHVERLAVAVVDALAWERFGESSH